MFESYYQLTENPFRLSADESYRFAHKNYLKAWSHLSYSLEQGEGFVMITGRPGSGKTTLIRDILAKLDKSKVLAINLVTNQLQAEELLRKVALEFGLPAESFNKATLLTRIQDYVEKEYQGGRRAVIVIDEAQNLTLNGLEELRLLSNLQSGSHPLFQIILVGQDELRGVILSPEMEHIRQRLIATCNIEPMNAEQTEGYIEHRLGIVGWNGDPAFDPAVFPLVHYLTGGVPRKINHVVGRLLLYGALEEIHDFSLDDVWIVAKELFDEERLSLKDGQSFEAYRDAYSKSESPDESPEGSLAPAGITHSTPPQVTVPISSDIPEDSVSEENSPWDDFGEYHEEDSAAAFPVSKIHLDEDEVAQLTSRIKEEQPAGDESNNAATEVFSRPGTAAGEEDVTVRNKQNLEGFNSDTSRQTEEILKLPSMRAEKRKHDIETQGGLLNTSDTLEEPEILSSGIGRSVRHILLFIALGSAIMAWYIMYPNQFAELWSKITTWTHKFQFAQLVTTDQDPRADAQLATQPDEQLEETQDPDSSNGVTDSEVQVTEISETNPDMEQAQTSVEESDGNVPDETSSQSLDSDDYIATQTKYEQSTVEPAPVPEQSSRVQEFQIFFSENDASIPKQFDNMLNDLFIVLSLNKTAKLKIRGYIDPSEQPLEAMRDALARAQRVSRYFIDKGIEQPRIQVESHSILPKDLQNEPRILDEKLSEGRVELILTGG